MNFLALNSDQECEVEVGGLMGSGKGRDQEQ